MRRRLTTAQVFEAVIVLGVFALALRNVGDPDFWWHLRTGQYIVTSHSVPHADFFSHTNAGKPWIAHEWLSEVFIYLAYRYLGWTGLIASFATLTAGAFWVALRRCAGRPYVAGLATLWAAVATIPFWGVRPQMFTMLLSSVFLYLLDRDAAGAASAGEAAIARRRLLWWMPVLMVLWVNLHGGFAAGLAILGLAVVAELIDAGLRPAMRTESLRRAGRLATVTAACAVAVLFNPNTYRMYLYPLETVGSSSIQGFIYEWASPDFHLPRMQVFAALLIATFLLVAVSRWRPKTRDVVLAVCTGFFALQSSKQVPLFALVAIPMIAAALSVIAKSWRGMTWLTEGSEFQGIAVNRNKVALNAVILVALAAACVLRAYHVGNEQPAFEAREMPKGAVAFLRQQRPPGPIFNSYEWGGYLIRELYPDYRVYVDGRSDVYGDKFLSEFVRTYKGEADWEGELRKYHVNTAVVPPDCPLAVLLRDDPRWHTVFEDRQAVVFVRREQNFVPEGTTLLTSLRLEHTQ